MFPEDTVRYQLDGREADQEWQALAPRNGGIIRLGPANKPFRITMLHQLWCLDMIRIELQRYNLSGPPAEITNHCLNYLRQMALCQSRTHLESIRSNKPPALADINRSIYQCRDWRPIYEFVGSM
jgi:hypothetical protein